MSNGTAACPHQRDRYGLRLTTTPAAAVAYNAGVGRLLRVRGGATEFVAKSVALDPTFALGHAALALLGYEFGAPVDVHARMRAALRHVHGATERERSHAYAVVCHVRGDSAPLLRHLRTYPTDALLLSVAVPTIAFAGVTTVPGESWAIVETAAPAFGDDWWFAGLLGFIRQEQGRWDDAMRLATRSLEEVPDAGQAAHARTHVHYETGDHRAGLRWLDGWISAAGVDTEHGAHFSWHAALHELSLGDHGAVARRYDTQLAPPAVTGCRALVDSASLLWRWALTPGDHAVPDVDEVLSVVEADLITTPPSPFVALHAAVALSAAGDVDRLDGLSRWAAAQPDPTYAEAVVPLADSLAALASGRPGEAADQLIRMRSAVVRIGGSDAQREVIEDTLIAALLAAGRSAEATQLLDARLDRRPSPRDRSWRRSAALSRARSDHPGR
jgi:hypothetical protein